MSSQNQTPDERRRNGRVLHATIDISTRFIRLSPSWEQLLGWEVQALLGTTFVVRVHPDDMETAIGAIHTALGSGKNASFIARYAHRDGAYLSVRWRVTPRLDQLVIDLVGRPA